MAKNTTPTPMARDPARPKPMTRPSDLSGSVVSCLKYARTSSQSSATADGIGAGRLTVVRLVSGIRPARGARGGRATTERGPGTSVDSTRRPGYPASPGRNRTIRRRDQGGRVGDAGIRRDVGRHPLAQPVARVLGEATGQQQRERQRPIAAYVA